MLHYKASIKGHGWGCVICGLPSDGAVAALCDSCLIQFQRKGAELKFACRGYPASEGRIPIAQLVGVHDHNMERHIEERQLRESVGARLNSLLRGETLL
jgi:hypothetical protein